MIIDSHHHLWNYSALEYGWIGQSMGVLKADYTPRDFEKTASAIGVGAGIAVQARQTIEETEWLLGLADKNPFIAGVVGWLPLASLELASLLGRFAANPKLRGVRHVVQDEPDDGFILRPDFNAGIDRILPFGLVYDILVFERHLPQTIRFVDRHPGQRFVLDHCAKPAIASGSVAAWRENVRELAKRPNVACKISGLVTEADPSKDLKSQCGPVIETVLEAFGPGRCMFGSDWPVCLTVCGYEDWYKIVDSFALGLSASDRASIFGGTAEKIYGLRRNP